MTALNTAEISLSTPALLLPAISLLMLAYTNRFIVLANLVRNLHEKYQASGSSALIGQIRNLRFRIELIKYMQAAGVLSLILCVVCMFALFAGSWRTGQLLFGLSLLMMVASLALSLLEIWMSVNALNLHLSDLEKDGDRSIP